MLTKAALFGLLASPFAAAHLAHSPRQNGEVRCGNENPPASLVKLSKKLKQEEEKNTAGADADFGGVTPQAAITIDTHFHVIAASNKFEDGYVPQSKLDEQLKVFQETYGPSGFAFNLKSSTYYINATWANEGQAYETVYRPLLRKGNYRALNVYILKTYTGSCYYGRATFPKEGITVNDPDYKLDGVFVWYTTLPGIGDPNCQRGQVNGGKSLTHETGHWLGLFHTFAGGCSGDGDLVSDTPPELNPTYECNVNKDTCTSDKLKDPIHNYMDYSDDSCMTEFTTGQITRMNSIWAATRANAP